MIDKRNGYLLLVLCHPYSYLLILFLQNCVNDFQCRRTEKCCYDSCHLKFYCRPIVLSALSRYITSTTQSITFKLCLHDSFPILQTILANAQLLLLTVTIPSHLQRWKSVTNDEKLFRISERLKILRCACFWFVNILCR